MRNYQQLVEGFMNPETLKTKEGRLLNGLLGLNGEAGEATELLKKHLFHAQPFDREKFKKELGDVYFYLAECCSAIDTTLDEIAMLNVDKLNERHQGQPWSAEAQRAKRDEFKTETSGTVTSPDITITSVT